jgi:hypothetical protein
MTINIDFTKYSETDLLDLNLRLVAYMRDKRQADTYHQLAKYNFGDRVAFTNNIGETVSGIVVRVNKKTVSIHTDDHHHWNVSPHLLKKAGGRSKQGQAHNVIDLFGEPRL